MQSGLKYVLLASIVLTAKAAIQSVLIAIQVIEYHEMVEEAERDGLSVFTVPLGSAFRFYDILGVCVTLAVAAILFSVYRRNRLLR